MKMVYVELLMYMIFRQIHIYLSSILDIFHTSPYLNMSEEHQLPSDSDEDDEDYVPNGADSDPVSEVESEGDIESGPEDENDENKRQTGRKAGAKRSKGRKSKKAKRRRTLEKSMVSEEEDKEEEECKEKKELTEEEEKKRADSLWADFMKDTGTKNITVEYHISLHYVLT